MALTLRSPPCAGRPNPATHSGRWGGAEMELELRKPRTVTGVGLGTPGKHVQTPVCGFQRVSKLGRVVAIGAASFFARLLLRKEQRPWQSVRRHTGRSWGVSRFRYVT